jgi:homoserine O-succinyltransferase
MPVYLDLPLSLQDARKYARVLNGPVLPESRTLRNDCIHIGLINNMPDGALEATERQFFRLLQAAAGRLPVRLTFYCLPEVPRSTWGRHHADTVYSSVADLWDRPLDGLIVTGAEPRFPTLAEEPYWDSLQRVIQWADENTSSSIWSCLAAHAAVLGIDGIQRQRLSDKRFGLFPCMPASDHALTTGAQGPMMPHSRWNELPEKELAACGYQVLTRSNEAGADAFVKRLNSLFVFFQGHPEYEYNTLLLEYRRDIGRYLRGERETYPSMPCHYFDSAATAVLSALRERALRDRREQLLADFPADLVPPDTQSRWQLEAARIYANWLTYLSERKQQPLAKQPDSRPVGALAVRRLAAGAD